MVFYTGLARLARDAGLVVREVNGWKSRTLGTRPNGMAGARGCLWHHTATSASAVKSRNNPTLNYMVNGLGYPLANFGLAWDGSIDVIAAGAAAHAGKGRYGSRIPQDRGNDFLLGGEVEGTVGLTWSDAQLESAARFGHAMNKEWGGSFLQIGHLEYAPGRKIDPSGIPGGMPALRKAIARGYWKNKNWKPGGKVSTGTTSSGTSKPKPAPKKSSSGGSKYPHVALPVTSSHTTASHNAWVYLMRHAVNRTDRNLTINIQRWLRDLGYYKRNVDGDFGAYTVEALQLFLRDKGLYTGVIDAHTAPYHVARGPRMIRAEIAYLNDQRQYLI